MAVKTFLPGQTITISYTSKGYAVSVAKAKSKKASVKTKHYSNLSLLLDDTNFSVSTTKNGENKTLLNLSTSKNKKKITESSSYYDSVRPYNEGVLYQAELPGYRNAYFEFINLITGKPKVIGFMISPNGVSESRSNAQQISKTTGGWYIMRAGKNIGTINITGYMLDTKYCQERNDFIERYWKQYIEDKKNANNEYVNEWSVNLIIEGKKYIGFLQGLQIQKSSVQPFLYQYNMTYNFLNDVLVHQSSESIKNRRAMKTPKNQIIDADTGKVITTIGSSTAELLGVV